MCKEIFFDKFGNFENCQVIQNSTQVKMNLDICIVKTGANIEVQLYVLDRIIFEK